MLQPPAPCSASVSQNGPSPAFQVTTTNGVPSACYALGRDLAQKPQPKSFALVDPTDPARGISMTYTGESGQAGGGGLSSISGRVVPESQDWNLTERAREMGSIGL